MPSSLNERVIAKIDLAACRYNAKLAKSIFNNQKKLIAVVKANAYGLGVDAIVKALQAEVDYFAVANLDEAREIRAICLHPIIILGALTLSDKRLAIASGFDYFVSNLTEITTSIEISEELKIAARMHLKIDVGMGRLGWHYSELSQLASSLASIKGLNFQGLAAHLGYVISDEPVSFSPPELERFLFCQKVLADFSFPMIHMLNSQGILLEYDVQDNYIRPGLMLYGVAPVRYRYEPQVVLTLESRVLLIKDLPVGSTISYGGKSVLDKPSKVAIVPVGYADGYPRQLSPEAYVLINGTPCKILGVVTMDMIMVDISTLADVALGEVVTLIGTNQSQTITIEQVSLWSNKIPWELFTGLGRRVEKVYLNASYEN